MTNPDRPRLAVIYGRVSTAIQGSSVEAQEHLPEQYCADLALPVIHRFADPDTSGSTFLRKREEGAQMLTLLLNPASGITDLVVTFQDRLGRNALDQIGTILEIWAAGVTPHFVCEGGACPRTPDNELKFNLKAVIAQDELNRIRGRIRVGLDRKKSRGELCGTVPYGFDAAETGATTGKGVRIRTLTDNFDEQRWLLHMHQRRAEGWGYHRIAKELNALGVPTKRRGELLTRQGGDEGEQAICPGRWQCGNVSNVLHSKTTLAWLDLQPHVA